MPPLPKGMKEKFFFSVVSPISTVTCCELSRAKQVMARDSGSRRDLKSGLARALSLVRIDANCACYYFGLCDGFFFLRLLWFLFSHTAAVQLLANRCSPLRLAWTT